MDEWARAAAWSRQAAVRLLIWLSISLPHAVGEVVDGRLHRVVDEFLMAGVSRDRRPG
jgi:hypothetical protein